VGFATSGQWPSTGLRGHGGAARVRGPPAGGRFACYLFERRPGAARGSPGQGVRCPARLRAAASRAPSSSRRKSDLVQCTTTPEPFGKRGQDRGPLYTATNRGVSSSMVEKYEKFQKKILEGHQRPIQKPPVGEPRREPPRNPLAHKDIPATQSAPVRWLSRNNVRRAVGGVASGSGPYHVAPAQRDTWCCGPRSRPNMPKNNHRLVKKIVDFASLGS